MLQRRLFSYSALKSTLSWGKTFHMQGHEGQVHLEAACVIKHCSVVSCCKSWDRALLFCPSLIYVLQIQATSHMPMGAEAVTLTLHSAAHAFIWKLGGKIEDMVQCLLPGAYNCHFSLFQFFISLKPFTWLICTVLNNIMCHFIKSCLKNNTNNTCKPVVSTSIQKCCQRSNILGTE